jgi:hypothetical protein
MHNIVLLQQIQSLRNFNNQILQMNWAFPHLLIQRLILDNVIVAFARFVLKQVVQVAAERAVAELVDDPSVELLDLVVVHDEDVVDARVRLELFARFAVLEEVVAEPDLF